MKLLSVLILSLATVRALKTHCFKNEIYPAIYSQRHTKSGVYEAREGKYPFMVAIFLKKNSEIISFCSGSLITEEWILTAAHCFTNKVEYLVVAGNTDIRSYFYWRQSNFSAATDEEKFHIQERKAIEWLIHPDFVPDDSDNDYRHDLAFVKVNKPFVLDSRRVDTIQISEDKMTEEKECTILGFGLTEKSDEGLVLHVAENKIAKTTETGCQRKKTGPFICSVPDDRGICKGDSGSPLICDGKVWGVLSHYLASGPNCGDSLEEYYAEIYPELNWIKKAYNSAQNHAGIDSKLLLLIFAIWMFLITV